jgi:hypothetical protein
MPRPEGSTEKRGSQVRLSMTGRGVYNGPSLEVPRSSPLREPLHAVKLGRISLPVGWSWSSSHGA